ncbi:MAG: hypothetical protein ACLGSD_06300 [Acidobacteriota bacterium]
MQLPRLSISVAMVCALLAVSQLRASDENPKEDAVERSTVAFVYVSSIPKGSSVPQVVALALEQDGRLHPVPGSPYPEALGAMAVNGSSLMGADWNKGDIDTYRIEWNGSLTRLGATDYAKYNNPGGTECGAAGQLTLDHTGSDLYVQEYNGSNACANTVIASFGVPKPAGDLNYLATDVTGVFPGVWDAPSFIGNNTLAYVAENDACMYWSIYGFQRSSNGSLNSFNFNYSLPTPGPGFRTYIPYLTAADPTNHLAMTVAPANPPGCTGGPLQLATFTVDAKGNLTTTSTYQNMPVTHIVTPYDLKMSPSGMLLAVAGQEGLQVFHYNGANPITHYTALLTSDPVNQMFWDNDNHLYAISTKTGKLRVYTITPTSMKENPGSPYNISAPQYLTVQPWPLPWDKN